MGMGPLGRRCRAVSLSGVGTVTVGRNGGVKYPRGFDLPDDGAVIALLEEARALGINLLDTAPAYGVSEQRLGALLPGARSDWVIVSKAGDRKSVVKGKSGSVRVDLGGRRLIKKKKNKINNNNTQN